MMMMVIMVMIMVMVMVMVVMTIGDDDDGDHGGDDDDVDDDVYIRFIPAAVLDSTRECSVEVPHSSGDSTEEALGWYHVGIERQRLCCYCIQSLCEIISY